MLKIESLLASLIEGTACEVNLVILMHLLQTLNPAVMQRTGTVDFSLIVENMVEALSIFSFRHHEPSSLQRLGVASPKQLCGVICDLDSDCEDSGPSSWFNVLPKSLKSFPSYV